MANPRLGGGFKQKQVRIKAYLLECANAPYATIWASQFLGLLEQLYKSVS